MKHGSRIKEKRQKRSMKFKYTKRHENSSENFFSHYNQLFVLLDVLTIIHIQYDILINEGGKTRLTF